MVSERYGSVFGIPGYFKGSSMIVYVDVEDKADCLSYTVYCLVDVQLGLSAFGGDVTWP